MLSNNVQGYILASLAGATFGMIPLFTIPIINDGIGYTSLLAYRFFFGSIGMLIMLLFRQVSLRISIKDFLRISILSFLYLVSAMTLFISYSYISSGVATALLYTDPLWCALSGIIILKQRPTWHLFLAMGLAMLGVSMLSGTFRDAQQVSLIGLVLALSSGFVYGIYLFIMPLLKISKMPSLKFTFYIFLNALLISLIYSFIFEGGIDKFESTKTLYNLILMGLVPTAFSNICVIMALRRIDTTIVAILGAFEPFTAMLIGILVFKEPYDVYTISGGLLILIAIWVLITKKTY